MALATKAGVFALNTATGNQAITGVGFQPTVVLFLPTNATGDGVSVNAYQGIGVGISSSDRRAITGNDEDGQATTDAYSRHADTKCLLQTDPGSSGVEYDADFVTMDADGFTINVTTAPGTAKRVGYLAIGGTDLTNVASGMFAHDNTLGEQAVTGVGFQPDALIFFNIDNGTAPDDGKSDGQFALSWALSSTERGYTCIGMNNGQPASDTGRAQDTDGAVVTPQGNGGVRGEADFVSMDADGFTVDWTNTDSNNPYVHFIALQGGQYAVGAITSQTSTGNWATSGLGFQPAALILASFCNAATTLKVDGAEMSVGVATSSADRFVAGCVSENAQASSDADSFQDDGLVYQNYDFNQGVEGAADFVSFGADGFTLNQTDADPTGNQILYFAIGADVAPVGRIPRYGFTNFQVPGIV